MGPAPNFKNILFDLGGVILDINVQATLKQFYELGFPAELMQFPNSMTTDLYFRYETGKLDTEQFRNEIRKAAGIEMTDHAFDEAWNAMLVRFPEERIALLEESVADMSNVRVGQYDCLTVDYAQIEKAQVIVRGLRVFSDFEFEFRMALTNQRLAPGVEMVFLMTRQEHTFLSASTVKEVADLGGDISTMVPPHVRRALSAHFGREGG